MTPSLSVLLLMAEAEPARKQRRRDQRIIAFVDIILRKRKTRKNLLPVSTFPHRTELREEEMGERMV